MTNLLIIKKGETKIVEIDRSFLITSDPSGDGIVFLFKNGFQLYYTDNDMPIHTKDLIRTTTSSFPTAHLTIDVANYNKPVLIEPTNIKK